MNLYPTPASRRVAVLTVVGSVAIGLGGWLVLPALAQLGAAFTA